MAALAERLQVIQERMAAAAERGGRSAAAVRLVAVSKTVSPEVAAEAFALGQTRFGESRPQELERKAQTLPKAVEWHLIGHLQRNKAKQAVRHAALIHSVDSVALAHRLNDTAATLDTVQQILLQVNVAGEAQKFGLAPGDLDAALAEVLGLPAICCLGFMTMAPYGASETRLHAVFGGLRDLAEQARTTWRRPFPELSMGMSGDFEVAIAEGATLVRVGSAIFSGEEANG